MQALGPTTKPVQSSQEWRNLVIPSKYIKYVNIEQWKKDVNSIRESESLDNRCKYKIEYSYVHDRLMLLHMQAYGFMQFDVLKGYKCFSHIPLTNLAHHTYSLLNCTCVKHFNELNLDPMKVQFYFTQKRNDL